jgi:hypothetical protein
MQLNKPAQRRRWRLYGLIALGVLAYEIIWVITALDIVNPTDLDVFFFPAVRIALAGRPLDIYQLRVALVYPNANGPLGLIPVFVASWLASLRGWLENVMLRRALLFALTAPFPLLIAWESARAIERFGARIGRWSWPLVYLPLLLAPELWLSALYYGHIEQIIAVWLILVAIRMLSKRRPLLAGVLLGLALLARSDVTLIIIPVGLTLLARKQLRATAWLALGGFLAVAAGLSPFLMADRSDTLFSLAGFHAALPVGGGNVWSLSGATSYFDIADKYDAYLAIGLAILLTLAILLANRKLTVASADFYLLLALCSLCFALLIKTLWPYYFQEAALLASVWALARLAPALAAWSETGSAPWRAAWPTRVGAIAALWAPRMLMLGCALFAEFSLEMSDYGGWQKPWSLFVAYACVGIVALTFFWLLSAPYWLVGLLTEAAPIAPNVPGDSGDILPAIALDAPTGE